MGAGRAVVQIQAIRRAAVRPVLTELARGSRSVAGIKQGSIRWRAEGTNEEEEGKDTGMGQ